MKAALLLLALVAVIRCEAFYGPAYGDHGALADCWTVEAVE